MRVSTTIFDLAQGSVTSEKLTPMMSSFLYRLPIGM